MYRFAAASLFCATVTALALAQDKKWEPPAVPNGWRSVTSKDGVYMFAAPKEARRTGTRERSYTTGGIRVRVQVDYFVLNDGTEMTMQSASVTGAAVKGLTENDLTDIWLNTEKEAGYTVSDPKEVTVGKIKAREYRMTKGGVSRRVVLFATPPRIFLMDVAAAGQNQLDTKAADTFLSSFVLVPPDVMRAAAKDKSDKNQQAAKAGQEKVGVKWTLNLKAMTFPDAPVVGLIRGREFRPDKIELDPAGTLVFRQGQGFFADVQVDIVLFLKPGEALANKTITIAPANFNPAGSPHLRLSTLAPNGKVPDTDPILSNYALKLTFSAKDKDGYTTGRIYLCTSDAAKSVLAGNFTVIDR